MTARYAVACLARACLAEFERRMAQHVPLADPKGLVGLTAKTWLTDNHNTWT